MKKYTLGLFLFAMLVGCQEDAKTVDYYTKHHEERREVILRCEESGSSSKKCENAIAAFWRASKETSNMPGID